MGFTSFLPSFSFPSSVLWRLSNLLSLFFVVFDWSEMIFAARRKSRLGGQLTGRHAHTGGMKSGIWVMFLRFERLAFCIDGCCYCDI